MTIEPFETYIDSPSQTPDTTRSNVESGDHGKEAVVHDLPTYEMLHQLTADIQDVKPHLTQIDEEIKSVQNELATLKRERLNLLEDFTVAPNHTSGKIAENDKKIGLVELLVESYSEDRNELVNYRLELEVRYERMESRLAYGNDTCMY